MKVRLVISSDIHAVEKFAKHRKHLKFWFGCTSKLM